MASTAQPALKKQRVEPAASTADTNNTDTNNISATDPTTSGLRANDIVRFYFVDDVSQYRALRASWSRRTNGVSGVNSSDEWSGFAPTFTHQVFPRELVFGFARLDIRFIVATSLAALGQGKHASVLLVVTGDALPGSGKTHEQAVAGLVKKLGKMMTPQLDGGQGEVSSSQTASTGDRGDGQQDDDVQLPDDCVFTVDEREFQAALETAETQETRTETDVQWSCGSDTIVQLSTPSKENPVVRRVTLCYQALMLFFIDAASCIDVDDGRWEVMLALVKRGDRQVVAGFTSIYNFFAFPDSTRLRVSQMMVLPPFQRRSLGRLMFERVYALADERQALEITVEDPGADFQALRDMMDCRRALAAGVLHEGDKLKAWDKQQAVRDAKTLRCTPAQLRRCWEIFKLREVDTTDDAQVREYRLTVKRRVAKDEIEILSPLEPAEKKSWLQEFYEDSLAHYRRVLARLQRDA